MSFGDKNWEIDVNRRDAIKTGLSVLSAVGIEGEVQTITTQNPQAFVVRTPRHLPQDAHSHIQNAWKMIFAGTPLENVPVLVLDGGASLEVVDLKEV